MSSESEKFATPRVAAGVLFRDDRDRVLLVKPTYKDGWEIPGGYVEQGESPLAAALREVREELGASLEVGELLVLDWAPHPAEGDKLLIIFSGRHLTDAEVAALDLKTSEISEARFFDVDQLGELMPDRLARRVAEAARRHTAAYLEHGHVV
ncbi:NUDIX hydrolase [Microlunatus ginsengisoli]|uniref:Nudix hydrolase domain-containing protein n=1 Tax=Microlunatus ginsengisoli TaxID=363863 RepID=A0ABP6ZL69_9ACTN